MKVLGLTGGMGAGKSMVARLMARRHWPIFDADAEVHRLQARGGAAIPALSRLWPEAIVNGAVNRNALRRAVIGNPEAVKQIELVMHPLIRQARRRFIAHMQRERVRGCVLDIPLLFETGAELDCDAVIVVTAPITMRLGRIMKRRSLTEAQARHLLMRQMSDEERLRRADYVVQTGLSRFYTTRQLARVLQAMAAR